MIPLKPLTPLSVIGMSGFGSGQAVPIAPIYLMTEPLVSYVDTDSPVMFMWVQNSSSSGATHNGKLYQANGVDPYYPLIADYTQNGTINLYDGNYIDTKWIPSATSEWTFSFIHNVVLGVSYDIVSLNSKGDGTADVWRGDESTAISLAVADTGLDYIPPLTAMVLTENINRELIPTIPTCTITMDSYALGVGETATVTFTFNTIPLGFAIGDITSDNGAISSLTQSSDEWIYTATFTPTEDIDDANNVITVSGTLGEFTDQWGNESNLNFVSDNYSVATETLGADMIIGNGWLRSDGNGSISTITPDGSRGFELDVTTAGTGTARPSISLGSSSVSAVGFIAGSTYEHTITIDSLTSAGDYEFTYIYDGGLTALSPVISITAGTVTFRHTYSNNTANTLMVLYTNGLSAGISTLTVSEWTIKEVL